MIRAITFLFFFVATSFISSSIVLAAALPSQIPLIDFVKHGDYPDSEDELTTITWINNERVVYQFAEANDEFDAPSYTGVLFATNIGGIDDIDANIGQ
ncbi:hypothetical protein BAE46_09735 [Glaciecola punicea]|uniref:hypothetical protein n=1 Tax=Glaciecola punicea TaxID=56804 RepID=UPI000872EBB1|nr:hypothetical protein [Glaciecola punicea]OFA30929.1 hypothetical protein BAE46_09735 [Glaciecola punicea]